MKNIVLVLSGTFFMFFFAGCTTPTLMDQVAGSQLVVTPHINGSKPIAFHRVIIEMPPGKLLGQLHTGLFRTVTRDIYWNQGGNLVGPNAYNQAASDTLHECGFDVLGYDQQVFGENDSYKARYQLGATIRDINFNAYDPLAGNFSEANVLVEWQLEDSFSRQIILTNTTSGYAKLPGFNAGTPILAFKNALKQMIATGALTDLLATNAPESSSMPVLNSEPLHITVTAAQSNSLPENLDRVMQGVVYIRAGGMLGSGVIVSPDGYILTAAHVVSGTSEVAVRFKSGLQLNASVIRIDEDQDVALIKMPGTGHHAVELNLGDPEQVGGEIYAIGSPLSEDLAFTVTKGVISAYRERQGDKAQFIQTDAALNPGNSGGPLLDKSGKVIGIVSSKIAIPSFEGLAFGVPMDVIARRLGIVWNNDAH
jgi:serine protease Do